MNEDNRANEGGEENKEQLISSSNNQLDEMEYTSKNENIEKNIEETPENKEENQNKETIINEAQEEKKENEDEDEGKFIIENIDDRNWFRRTFGKMSPGALRGSIFSLSILSLGIGSLAIPQKIGIMGIILSPIFIISSGLANLWSLRILGDMCLKFKLKKYEQVVSHLFGKGMSYFVGIVMIINQTGVIILYQVILYKLLGGIINELGKYNYPNIEDFAEYTFWNKFWVRFLVCYGITIIILFPLCQLKDVSKMRYASTFGMFSLFILIFIIVVECPFFIKENIVKNKQPLNYYDILPGLKGNMKLLQSIVTLFYAYACHVGAFPVFESLYNPTKKRIDKLLNRAISIDIICYLIIGAAGYLSQPLKTPDLIIERDKIFSSDWLMTLGNFFFMFTLIAKICVNYNAQRSSILILLQYKTNDFPNSINYIITSSVLAITTIVAISFQSISDYISLIGSFCTVVICFCVPGMIYIKGNDYPLTYYKNILTIIFISLILIIGITSGIFTIKGIIEK